MYKSIYRAVYENAASAVADAAIDAGKTAVKEGAHAVSNLARSAEKTMGSKVMKALTSDQELMGLAEKHGFKTLNEFASMVESGKINPDDDVISVVASLIKNIHDNTNNRTFFKRLGDLFNTSGSKNRQSMSKAIKDYDEYLYNKAGGRIENLEAEITRRVEEAEKDKGSMLGTIIKWAAVVLGVGGASAFVTSKVMSNKNDDQYNDYDNY